MDRLIRLRGARGRDQQTHLQRQMDHAALRACSSSLGDWTDNNKNNATNTTPLSLDATRLKCAGDERGVTSPMTTWHRQ